MFIPEDNKDVQEQLVFTVEKAKRDIYAWKAHQLRSINQDDARFVLGDSQLDDKSVHLVQDLAIKFLPRKYRRARTTGV